MSRERETARRGEGNNPIRQRADVVLQARGEFVRCPRCEWFRTRDIAEFCPGHDPDNDEPDNDE